MEAQHRVGDDPTGPGGAPRWPRTPEICGQGLPSPSNRWPEASRGAYDRSRPQVAANTPVTAGRPGSGAPRCRRGDPGRAEVTYAAVLARPVHHRLVVRRVPLEHERRAGERGLRPRSRSGSRRRPHPAPLARGGGSVLAGTCSGTRVAGLRAATGQRSPRERARRGPGQLDGGTPAPGLGEAPRRPAGDRRQQQQQQQERP